jgi:hypothetical protein
MCSKLISLVLTFIHFWCIQLCEETESLLFRKIICYSVLMFQIYYTLLYWNVVLLFVQVECQQELPERKCMSTALLYWRSLVHILDSFTKVTTVLAIELRRLESRTLTSNLKARKIFWYIKIHSAVCIFIFGWERHKHYGMSSIKDSLSDCITDTPYQLYHLCRVKLCISLFSQWDITWFFICLCVCVV